MLSPETCVRPHIENLLSEGSWFHTADETQEQIHHGGYIYVVQHQADEVVFFPQERDHLDANKIVLKSHALLTK